MKVEDDLILRDNRSILLDDIANHLIALVEGRWSFRLDLLRAMVLLVAVISDADMTIDDISLARLKNMQIIIRVILRLKLRTFSRSTYPELSLRYMSFINWGIPLPEATSSAAARFVLASSMLCWAVGTSIYSSAST